MEGGGLLEQFLFVCDQVELSIITGLDYWNGLLE